MHRDTRIARADNVDMVIEPDTGVLSLQCTFYYDGETQNAYIVPPDMEFVKRFVAAFGVNRLQQCNGKTVLVFSVITDVKTKIVKIEPRKGSAGESFDIEAYCAQKNTINTVEKEL